MAGYAHCDRHEYSGRLPCPRCLKDAGGYDMKLLVPCLRSTAQIDEINGDARSADMLRTAAAEIERLRRLLHEALDNLDHRDLNSHGSDLAEQIEDAVTPNV